MTNGTRTAAMVALLTMACDINLVGPEESTGDTGEADDGADDAADDAADGADDGDDDAPGDDGEGDAADSESGGGTSTTGDDTADDGDSSGVASEGGDATAGDDTADGGQVDEGTDDDAGATCQDEPTCDECFGCESDPAGSCNPEVTACQAAGDCAGIAECWAECNMLVDDAEYEACWFDVCVAGFPDESGPFSAWLTCGLNACESACAG